MGITRAETKNIRKGSKSQLLFFKPPFFRYSLIVKSIFFYNTTHSPFAVVLLYEGWRIHFISFYLPIFYVLSGCQNGFSFIIQFLRLAFALIFYYNFVHKYFKKVFLVKSIWYLERQSFKTLFRWIFIQKVTGTHTQSSTMEKIYLIQ